MTAPRFWERKAPAEFSPSEWEALCDGCARCCMIKLQDAESDQVHYTAAVCDLLDIDQCRCTRYPQRHELVGDCVELNPERAASFGWLPTTCAYRIVAEGRSLPDWHPLISGSAQSVHDAGISVRDKVIPEAQVHEGDREHMIVRWIEQ